MSEETLAQILAAMPEEQRFILTLHYVKGLPQKEIAKTFINLLTNGRELSIIPVHKRREALNKLA
mgnify:CR=1 FL=1